MSNHDHTFVPLSELVLDAEGWTTGIAKCSICGDVVEFWNAPQPRILNQSVVTHHQLQRPITTDQFIASGEQRILPATSDQSVVISDQPSHPVITGETITSSEQQQLPTTSNQPIVTSDQPSHPVATD